MYAILISNTFMKNEDFKKKSLIYKSVFLFCEIFPNHKMLFPEDLIVSQKIYRFLLFLFKKRISK